MQREAGLAEVRFLGPDEINELFPYIDAIGLRGATWCPRDGFIFPGIVYQDGIFTRTSETFVRSKGKSTAIDITDMFMWSGMICFDAACDTCTATTFCRDANGILTPKGVDPCPLGSTEVTLYCQVYEIPTWVFNIGDFVNYLWAANNSGLKLLQVRFYPRYQ
jgi:hypothetical protein